MRIQKHNLQNKIRKRIRQLLRKPAQKYYDTIEQNS